ncbi:MAG: hypothetical protein GXX85_07880 [Ignavibacteria bacterium]|nr:hypothetical protein [Ignavibacteria bacterium]
MKKIIIIMFVSFFSCSDNKNDIETISKIYVEELVVREQYGGNYKLYKENYSEILKKYGHTKESYKNALKQIGNDPDKWESFFSESLIYLNELKEKADSSGH